MRTFGKVVAVAGAALELLAVVEEAPMIAMAWLLSVREECER